MLGASGFCSLPGENDTSPLFRRPAVQLSTGISGSTTPNSRSSLPPARGWARRLDRLTHHFSFSCRLRFSWALAFSAFRFLTFPAAHAAFAGAVGCDSILKYRFFSSSVGWS